jgi:hypothetical protein
MALAHQPLGLGRGDERYVEGVDQLANLGRVRKEACAEHQKRAFCRDQPLGRLLDGVTRCA